MLPPQFMEVMLVPRLDAKTASILKPALYGQVYPETER
jgi:hypothetical protein